MKYNKGYGFVDHDNVEWPAEAYIRYGLNTFIHESGWEEECSTKKHNDIVIKIGKNGEWTNVEVSKFIEKLCDLVISEAERD